MELWRRIIDFWRRSRRAWASYRLCPECRQWTSTDICTHCGFDAAAPGTGAARAQAALRRARQRSRRYDLYQLFNGIFRFHPQEHWLIRRAIVKWMALAGIVGVLAGTASAIFLISLDWATSTRRENPILLYFLPLVGLFLGWSYHSFAGPAARGNNLVIEEANANRNPIPLRMAPMVLIGTVLTHLFGGSAGREGTAVQMGSSLGHLLGVDPPLLAAIGFVALFAGASNTPLACALMGVELFGGGGAIYLAIGCSGAYLASGHRSIYITQLIGDPKATMQIQENETLAAYAVRQGGWLPASRRWAVALAQRPVRTLMTPDPISVDPDQPIPQVIEKLVAEGVRSAPVVDRRGQVVGIVTDNNLLHPQGTPPAPAHAPAPSRTP
jgi:hypothetical protein